MDALEVSISRIISCFCQCLEACLHQCAYTATENCLLTEEVCLCLDTECGLKKTCTSTTDTCTVSQCQILCMTGSILIYSDQTRCTLACLILGTYGMTRSLRSDHGYIHILRRDDLVEMDIEAVSEHQHISCLKVRLDVLLVKSSLQFIVDKDHDDIGLLGCFRGGIYLKALLLCPLPGLGALIKTDDDMCSGVLQVQRMRMALAAVADDSDRLSVEKGEITILFIENLKI